MIPITKQNYLQIIRQQYGVYVTNNVFYYGKANLDISKIKHDLIFLKTCKTENLLPKFVQFKISSSYRQHQYIIEKCYHKILINEIKLKKRKLTQSYHILNNLKSLLELEIDQNQTTEIFKIVNEIVKEKETTLITRHNKKLNKLRKEKNSSTETTNFNINDSAIKNYSRRILTTDEKVALINGLDFVFPSTSFNDETFIANIETFLANLLGYAKGNKEIDEHDEDEKITYNLTPEQLLTASKLRRYCDTFKQHAKKSLLKFKNKSTPVMKTLKNLAKDKSIYITRADKGRAVVILDKLEYIQKMEQILNQTGTFKKLEQDPTLKKEVMLQRKLLNLKNSGFITEVEYRFARPVGSQPGKAYGLPKIHKVGVPVRPIISTCNTYNYKLSKLLAKKLKHLRTNDTIVNDTFKFVNELNNKIIKDEKIKMISFDVISLFTKIPLEQTTELILDRMYGPQHICQRKLKKQTDWCNTCKNRNELKQLLLICTKDSHFIFNGNIYSQQEGIAMGSPLGPLYADVYMNYVAHELKEKLISNGMIYYKRFVDDSFVLIKENADTNKLLSILNSFDDAIQFTVEQENNNTLPFLDILITRVENIIGETLFTTSIYRKPTFTGLLLKWNSFVPHFYKISAISSLIYRAIRICSSYTSMHIEFEFIMNLAINNGYPSKFISNQIRKTLNRYYNKCNQVKLSPITSDILKQPCKKTEQIFIDLPYVGNATKTLGKKIMKLAQDIRPDINVQTIFRPPPAVASFFPQKDKTPKDIQSNLVYLISCSDCSESYIGHTTRQAIRRHHEHGAPKLSKSQNTSIPIEITPENINIRRSDRLKLKPKINYALVDQQQSDEIENTNIKRLQDSAIYMHHSTNNHQIDWKGWKIISKDNVKYRLKVRESLQILSRKSTLNKTQYSVPLIVYPEGIQSSKPHVKIKQTTTNND